MAKDRARKKDKADGYHSVETPAVDANTKVKQFRERGGQPRTDAIGVVCVAGRARASIGVYATNLAVMIRQSGPFSQTELDAGPTSMATFYPVPMPRESYQVPSVGAVCAVSPGYAQNYIAVWTKYGMGAWGQPVTHGFRGVCSTKTECELRGSKKTSTKRAAVKKKKPATKKQAEQKDQLTSTVFVATALKPPSPSLRENCTVL